MVSSICNEVLDTMKVFAYIATGDTLTNIFNIDAKNIFIIYRSNNFLADLV